MKLTVATAIPAGITRQTVLETVHSHVEMIDLNPLVIERHPIKAPRNASAEEYHCIWYQLTDRVQYLPGGMASGKVSYNACFHDLPMGLQTHVFAPMGLEIKNKWTLGGSLPGEPREPQELGLNVPKTGLWLREDVDMKCNMLMTSFVKKTLKKAHATLVARLVEKSHIMEVQSENGSDIASIIHQYSRTPSMHGSVSSGFQPHHSAFSDTESVRSSIISNPSLPSQYPTPYASPSFQNMDPGYNDARRSYQSFQHQPMQQKDPRLTTMGPLIEPAHARPESHKPVELSGAPPPPPEIQELPDTSQMYEMSAERTPVTARPEHFRSRSQGELHLG